MSRADVIVLGGGPAGSAAGITCAMAGLEVLLLEREAFPRAAPGESLHPGVEPLLKQLGVEDEVLAAGFPRHAGYLVRWGGPEQYRPFGEDAGGPWQGFQAWRPTLDGILLDRARSVGVRVIQPSRAHGAITDEGRAVGLETEAGPIHAEYIVDATGRGRALSRWLDLSWSREGSTRHAWYGYAEGRSPTGREDHPALMADANGWTWVARVREQTYQWVRLNFDNTRPPEGWLPPELVELQPTGPLLGADVTSRRAHCPAGPGYFLTGDAAAVLDPASSHGVLRALMSGIFAGHLAGLCCRANLPAEGAAERYSRWLRDWFDHDVARLDEFYGQLGVCN